MSKYVGLVDTAIFSLEDIQEVLWVITYKTSCYAEIYRVNTVEEAFELKLWLEPNRQYLFGTMPVDSYQISRDDSLIILSEVEQQNLSNRYSTMMQYQQLDSNHNYLQSYGYWSCVAANGYSVCSNINAALAFLKDERLIYPTIKLYPYEYIAREMCRRDYLTRYFTLFRDNLPFQFFQYELNELYIQEDYSQVVKSERSNESREILIKNGLFNHY